MKAVARSFRSFFIFSSHDSSLPAKVAHTQNMQNLFFFPQELGFGVMDTWLGDVGTCSARCGRPDFVSAFVSGPPFLSYSRLGPIFEPQPNEGGFAAGLFAAKTGKPQKSGNHSEPK